MTENKKPAKDFKYYKLAKTITIFIDGQAKHVSQGGYRFEEVKAALERGEEAQRQGNIDARNQAWEDAMKAIDPNSYFTHPFLVVRDGLLYHPKIDQSLPSFIGDRCLDKENPLSEDDLKIFVNLYYIAKKSMTEEQSKSITKLLMDGRCYGFSEDGNILLYKDNNIMQSQSPVKQLRDSGTLTFLNYNFCDNHMKYEFYEKRASLRAILQEVFGFSTKKLYELVYDRIRLQRKDNEMGVNEAVFYVGLALKGVVANDNILRLLSADFVFSNEVAYENAGLINDFLRMYSVLPNGTYNQERLMKIFANKNEVESLIGCARMHPEVYKDATDTARQQMKDCYLNRSLNESLDLLRNIQTDNENFPLRPQETFPKEYAALNGAIIGDLKVVIPHRYNEVAMWTHVMSNCIERYAKDMKNGTMFLAAFVKKDQETKMVYNMSIVNHQIRELKSAGNRPPNEADERMIRAYLREHKLIVG